MRIIARFNKGESVRFVSHLDIQRLFQRAFRRAGIPLAYSQGFNPHPLLSFATALSVGYTSDGEWLDIKLAEPLSAEDFITAVNSALPEGFRILEAVEADDTFPSLSAVMVAAEYELRLDSAPENAEASLEAIMQSPIMVRKKTKAGIRTVDIRPLLYDAKYKDDRLYILGCLDAQGSLNVDLFLHALIPEIKDGSFSVNRRCIYSSDGTLMPKKPELLN